MSGKPEPAGSEVEGAAWEPRPARRKTRRKRMELKDFIALEDTCNCGEAGRKELRQEGPPPSPSPSPKSLLEATPTTTGHAPFQEASPTGTRVYHISRPSWRQGKKENQRQLLEGWGGGRRS